MSFAERDHSPLPSAVRFDVQEALAAALRAHAPGAVYAVPEDVFGAVEIGLHACDAHDLALDLIEDLNARGFVITRGAL